MESMLNTLLNFLKDNILLSLLAVVVALYFLFSHKNESFTENVNNEDSDVFTTLDQEQVLEQEPEESAPKKDYMLGIDTEDEEYKKLGGVVNSQKTTVQQLLPKGDPSKWFKTPMVKTSIKDATLLADPEFVIGVNTIGSSKKGMTTDIRGGINVPKIEVAPWMKSSRDVPMNNALCNA